MVLGLAKRASSVWVISFGVQTSFDFEQKARAAYKRHDNEGARAYLISADRLRTYLAQNSDRLEWSLSMPVVGLSIPSIGVPDFVAMSRNVASVPDLSALCAAASLAPTALQAGEFQAVQSINPKMTPQRCLAMAKAFLAL